MAKAWKDVIASPQYQALAPEQKAQAQEQYFNEVVAPQAGDQAEQAKQAFYTAYPVQKQEDLPPPKSVDGSLASGFSQLATQQKEGLDRSAEQGASLGAAMREAVTGESRMTPELAKLQNVGSAPELNAFSTDALRAGVAQLFGSDASQEQVLQSMGATLSQDEKGNAIVNLPSGSYALNKPGLSPQDVTSFLANALAFTPASRAGSVLGAAAKSGATDLALQGATQAVGGEDINPLQVAASAALGGAVKGVERGAGAAYRSIKGEVPEEARDIIKFAKENDVPIHTTDLIPESARTRVGKAAQTTAENIPFVGTSGMRGTQQEARSKLVNDFAATFGEYDPSIIVGNMKAKASGIKQAAGNRLERIQSKMNGINIQPTKAIQQIDSEITNLQRLGKVADNDTISKLQAYRDELTRNAGGQGPMAMDLQQLSSLRSQFRQDVKGERVVMPSRSDAAVQRVYRAMTGDIESAIGRNLGADSLSKYRQANAVYANEANKIKNTRLKSILMKGDLTPEVVNNMLFSKNKSEIQSLYNSVGSMGRSQMRNGIIGKAIEKSNDSPDQFLRQLNILSNQTGIAFKGKDAAYVNGLKKYLQATKRAGQSGVAPPTGQQAIPFVAAAAIAANPKLAVLGGSYGALARVYESKLARDLILKMSATKPGTTAFEKSAAELSSFISSMAQGVRSTAPEPESPLL